MGCKRSDWEILPIRPLIMCPSAWLHLKETIIPAFTTLDPLTWRETSGCQHGGSVGRVTTKGNIMLRGASQGPRNRGLGYRFSPLSYWADSAFPTPLSFSQIPLCNQDPCRSREIPVIKGHSRSTAASMQSNVRFHAFQGRGCMCLAAPVCPSPENPSSRQTELYLR